MRKIVLLLAFAGVFIFSSCAKRPLISFHQLPIPSEVLVETTDGQEWRGVAEEKSKDNLKIRVSENQSHLFMQDSIRTIHLLSSEVDEGGKIITVEEIDREKTNNNTILYTVGGAVLSFGGSLFASSLIYRATDGEFKVVNPISLCGGVLGTAYLFFKGEKRDKMMALERIKDRRKLEAEKELSRKMEEKKKLLQAKEALEKEKRRIEAEKKRLEKELKKKKKKKIGKE